MSKPSREEEEYFKRQETHQKKQDSIRQEHEEREARQKLHYMKCPKCGADLAEESFQDVRIDRCTECNGVWLDPGELEAIGGKGDSFVGSLFSTLTGKR